MAKIQTRTGKTSARIEQESIADVAHAQAEAALDMLEAEAETGLPETGGMTMGEYIRKLEQDAQAELGLPVLPASSIPHPGPPVMLDFNYLCGRNGCITPLVDKDGRPFCVNCGFAGDRE